jgi:parallel beta-helix repeat protein
MARSTVQRIVRLIGFIALVIVCVLTLTIAAGERAVAQEAACTQFADPSNVQARLDAARTGDVICMAPGVYRGPLRIEDKTGFTLRGAGEHETIIAGGTVDALLIFRSRDLVLEEVKLYFGAPAGAYVWGSHNITFQRVHAGGGSIGIHYDQNSIGRISDSFVYAMSGDGILTRNGANVVVERNWVTDNGGVGVSTVGFTATTSIVRNIISDNEGPGVFAGQTPCALLPPGFVEVPECYLTNLRAFVGEANVILDGNVIQSSGSTGIVLFPGARGTLRNNRIWANELSGLFGWGATLNSEADQYDLNEEHAIELRAYPDPLKYPQVPSGQRIRAVARINNNEIRNTVVLSETGTLGGGFLAQGANVSVTNSRIYGNRGIGVSYVNTSSGAVEGKMIYDNGGSAICIYKAGNVTASGNTIYGNSRDAVGICHETTP